MENYYARMSNYDDGTLLSIVNRDRFRYEPEEVQMAIIILRERGVNFVIFSDTEIRNMNASKKWDWAFLKRLKERVSEIKEEGSVN